jgi:hypothetical protein
VGTKTLHHPVVGELVLDWDTLTANTDPEQHLTVWTAAPGSPTYERLRILSSWAGRPEHVALSFPPLNGAYGSRGAARLEAI